MKQTRIIISFLILQLLIISCLSAYTADENVVVRQTEHTISNGLNYINSVEVCNGVRQEIFTFEYTPNFDTKIIPAYGQYIYGFNSVGSMISSYEGEGRVVGGINTDFFITSTGIPLSCLISDREIISSCDNRVAIGFDEKGNAKIGYPNINSQLVSSDEMLTIPVAHINKTPSEWGVYLVTDKFYPTTKSQENSVDVVLSPFDKEKTHKNFENYVPSIPEISKIDYADESYEKSGDLQQSSEQEVAEEDILLPDVKKENEYMSEELLDLYVNKESKLFLGDYIDVVVTEIRYEKNSTIPEGSFVICIPQDIYDREYQNLAPGDEFTLEIDYDTYFSDCVNIFGAGTQIVKDGVKVPQEDNSVFKYRQPRTAAGIREDGSVLFVCVDGRNAGISSGFTATELSDYLIDKGCIDAINFDGGGSTTFYASDIGELNSGLKNTPSEGNERRVACGLMFINTSIPNGELKSSSMYPTDYVVYNSGSWLDIGDNILFADSNYHPITDNMINYDILVDQQFGIIEEGKFIPSGETGAADIYILPEDSNFALNAGKIHITDNVDDLDFYADISDMTPFDKSSKLSISAHLNKFPVVITNRSGEYTIYVEKEDEEGTYLSPVSEDFAYIDMDTFEFVPIIKGEKYFIEASLGGIKDIVEIYAEKYPFSDTFEHWSSKTTYHMFKNGYFVGETNDKDERFFHPDRKISSAEFCVVLYRILGLDDVRDDLIVDNITDEQALGDLEGDYEENFAEEPEATQESYNISNKKFDEDDIVENSEELVDIIDNNTDKSEEGIVEGKSIFDNVPKWARQAVETLYERGYIESILNINDNDEIEFVYDKPMSRMDVIRVIGAILENTYTFELPEEIQIIYEDYTPERENDDLYVWILSYFNIINGYEDGTLRQSATLTRAEAATVLHRMINFDPSTVSNITK